MLVLLRPHDSEEPIMQAVKTIGLDIAKSVFQVHGVDAEGRVMSKQRPAKIDNKQRSKRRKAC
jgi:hypothetical protein